MRKLKCTFKVNNKKTLMLNIPVDEMIHMDILRKVEDGAKKAYIKSGKPNPISASIELSRLISGQYDSLQQIADNALSNKPVNAVLKVMLTEPEVFGETLACHFEAQ